MNQATLNELKKTLGEERSRLINELKAIARPDQKMRGDWDASYPVFGAGEYGSHSARDEEAEEVEEYEVRLEAEHSLESRLLEITKALERMEKGKFGLCKECRKEIGTDRLKANPAAEFCTKHLK